MHEQRMAVGLRLRHLRGADGAARAGPVLDDGRLAELRGEFFGDRAGHDVGAAAGSERHDEAERLRRPGLRPRRRVRGAEYERRKKFPEPRHPPPPPVRHSAGTIHFHSRDAFAGWQRDWGRAVMLGWFFRSNKTASTSSVADPARERDAKAG